MNQEDKELLLKDLSARLPYGVKVNAQYKDEDGWKTEDRKNLGLYEDGQVYLDCVYTTIDCIKPYLRPMSSMTEDEKRQYEELCNEDIRQFTYVPIVHPGLKYKTSCHRSIDWLNKNMFDYRRLIEKGLALEAPEGMY